MSRLLHCRKLSASEARNAGRQQRFAAHLLPSGQHLNSAKPLAAGGRALRMASSRRASRQPKPAQFYAIYA